MSPVHSNKVVSDVSPSLHPVRSRTCTAGGQAFADIIHARDVALASRRAQHMAPSSTQDSGGDLPLSLLTILDFVSFVAVDSFPDSSHSLSLDSFFFPSFTSFDFIPFSFLSTPPEWYLRAPSRFSDTDLLRPPESYHEACSRPNVSVWCAAMERELESLRLRRAFEPADLPPGRKAIGVRWVYAFKYNLDGTIIRGKEKAQLVAQGFSQRPEDFDETYAPVVKMTSIHIILAFATSNDLEIMASFLHCRLCMELYCKQIPGHPLPDPSKVLHLLVALYSLRQSAYEFYMLLLRCFTALGMRHCEVDHAVFYGSWDIPPHPSIPSLPNKTPLFAFIPVHVDDGLVVTNSLPLYCWILSELQKSGDC